MDTLSALLSNALGQAGANRKDITRLRLAVGADEVKGLLLAWYDLCFMPYEPLGAQEVFEITAFTNILTIV